MIEETMTVNIGDLCTHCGQDTSGFVNRIPSRADGRLRLDSGDEDVTVAVTLDGWMCADCQMVKCDKCGQMTLDYRIEDSATPEIICSDCDEKTEVARSFVWCKTI